MEVFNVFNILYRVFLFNIYKYVIGVGFVLVFKIVFFIYREMDGIIIILRRLVVKIGFF